MKRNKIKHYYYITIKFIKNIKSKFINAFPYLYYQIKQTKQKSFSNKQFKKITRNSSKKNYLHKSRYYIIGLD